MATRSRLSSWFVPIVVIALAIPLLASCGGDDDGASTTTTSSSTTSSTEPTTSSSTTSTTDSSSTTSSTEPTTSSSTTTTTTSTTTSTTEPATRTVLVYFSTGDGTDCSEVTAFERTVDAALGPAEAAFGELVGGPTAAEEADGASSFFSAATADALRSVVLEDGVLTVDLEDIRAEISNAGTSCGSAAFVAQLTSTAFQFPTVDRARFLFAGSCDDFGAFIQTDICEFDRAG